MIKYIILYLFSVVISTSSQVLLKMSAGKERRSKLAEYLNPYVISAYFLLFVSLVVVSLCIKYIKTSYAPVIESLSYVLILFAGKIIFKEKITRGKIIGSIFIISGIIIFNL